MPRFDLAVTSTLAPPQSRYRSPAPPKGEAKGVDVMQNVKSMQHAKTDLRHSKEVGQVACVDFFHMRKRKHTPTGAIIIHLLFEHDGDEHGIMVGILKAGIHGLDRPEADVRREDKTVKHIMLSVFRVARVVGLIEEPA